MRPILMIAVVVAIFLALNGNAGATLQPVINVAKQEIQKPFVQGLALGAGGVLVLQTLTRGRLRR